jgi:hypothetical protein
MAGIIKNFIIGSLLYWIPMTSLPPLKTPSCKGNKPTKVSQSYHQNWTKSSSAPCEGQTHVLDFEREVDLDVYYEGGTPVLEGDNLFDLKAETLGQFLKLLDRNATDQGWNDASSAQQIGLFNIAQDDSFYSRITISITKEHNYVEMTSLRAQSTVQEIPDGEGCTILSTPKQSDDAGMHLGITKAEGTAPPCSARG